jgi:hypothetical protein
MFLFAMLLVLQGLSEGDPVRPATERVLAADSGASSVSLDEILDALRAVESGGQRDGGRRATGDGGRAIGPYQIHYAYFLDAGVEGRYEDCRDPVYARRVVIAYWERWCPDALKGCDAEVLARVHNGGPRGARKHSTLAYWHKVERRLLTAAAPSN